jgi:ribosome biogenesis GTPase
LQLSHKYPSILSVELSSLGFDDWFQSRFSKTAQDGCRVARVTAVNRDNYLVRDGNGETLAELSGTFMFSAQDAADYPVVGDWGYAEFFNGDTLAIIHELFPRKSVLRRKTAGKKIEYQMIASNIDTAFIVQSCDFDFNLRRLERYLVMVRDGNIEPAVLLSKADLLDEAELEQRVADIKAAGIQAPVLTFSCMDGRGIAEVERLLEPGRTFCLLGSSGVGKTTLLNRLVGGEVFDTAPVRQKDGKGRHTTARRQLVVLDQGAMLVDTPGIRELGNIGAGTGIDDIFADIKALADGCRFKDCTHTGEAGCAVLNAVQAAELDEGRYESYLKLLKESEHYGLSYAEKRREDRRLGKFFKSAKKDIKRLKKR